MQVPFTCPITRSPLRLVDRAELLALVYEPRSVCEGTEAAFVSREAGLAYPIKDNIAVFLASAAYKLKSVEFAVSTPLPRNESVRSWYEEFGWQKTSRGVYFDSALFTGSHMGVIERYRIASHLALVERLGAGSRILNAASGPLPHSEHSAYFLNFETPVCLDFSWQALVDAKQKLGAKAVYVQADICKLPFPNETFDGIISAYTIQHIDAEDQETALRELYRVLCVGGNLLVLNSNAQFQQKWRRRALMQVIRFWGKISRSLKGARHRGSTDVNSPNDETLPSPPSKLYTRTRAISWWRQQARNLGAHLDIESFRLLSNDEVAWFFENDAGGVRRLRALESFFPQLLASLSAYLLISLQKSGVTDLQDEHLP